MTRKWASLVAAFAVVIAFMLLTGANRPVDFAGIIFLVVAIVVGVNYGEGAVRPVAKVYRR